MQAIFRTDASIRIGTGHVMRCMTLAQRLRSRHIMVRFICRELDGHLCDLIESKGFTVSRLPNREDAEGSVPGPAHAHWLQTGYEEDARQTVEAIAEQAPSWLIVDHYALDTKWENVVRPYVKKLMVIDDLADRKHNCDLLLDQNFYEGMEERYNGLVPELCITFVGPRFTLLRDEFYAYKDRIRARDGTIRRLLIFFGGSDPEGVTLRALQAVLSLQLPDLQVDVVVGSSNPQRDAIQQVCTMHPNLHYYCQINHMAELMAQADLAIGAVGATTWERCFLGLPAITVVMAQNQEESTKVLTARGIIWNIGKHDEVDAAQIAASLAYAMHHPNEVRRMGLDALHVIDGNERDTIVNAIIASETVE